MGLFSRKNTEDEQLQGKSNENLGKMTSEKATSIIKELSGGQAKYKKKLIDNLVCITNASGGAGASTVTANVAYTAVKLGITTLVIDLNILYPIQQTLFAVKPELDMPDLSGYLLGKNTLGEAIQQTKTASLMFSNNRGMMDYINCDSDQAIGNFQTALQSLRGLFDLILIDCPMRIDSMLCNYAFYNADAIYIVWDEGISSIANTERIRRNMAQTGIEAYTKMKVVLNKRTDIHYNDYPFQKLNLDLVQYLPFDQGIIQSSLYSEIFCEKGASRSKNAGYFCGGIEALTEKILVAGGYVE